MTEKHIYDIKKLIELIYGDGMTENKRFVVEKYSVRDMSIDEKYVNSSYHIGDKGIAQNLCDLLNELADENKQLKQQIEDLEFNLQEVRKMVMWND